MNTVRVSTKLELLDVLRGVAILLVFGYHWHLAHVDRFVAHSDFFMNFKGVTWEQLYASFSPLNYGSTGVALFLIISGFLIHLSYLQRGGGKLDLKKFYARRFWRIYPPYLLVLFFFAFYNKEQTIYHLFTHEGRFSLLSHILMIHNLFGESWIIFGLNPSFWTIALEMQLYIIYPLFLFFSKRFGIMQFCKILLVIHLLSILLIYCLKGGFPDKLSEMTFVGHYWIVWALGALVADSWFHKERLFRVSWNGWFLMLLVFMISQVFLLFFVYLSGIMAAVLWAVFLDLCLHTPPSFRFFGGTLKRSLINIGLCSYSIYLIHQPIIGWLSEFVNWADSSRFTTAINCGIVFALIFFISYGLYVFIEQPSIRLGQKLDQIRSSK
jgi:peptidoglycan/LPS O-acetylase OafA/YrhL